MIHMMIHVKYIIHRHNCNIILTRHSSNYVGKIKESSMNVKFQTPLATSTDVTRIVGDEPF